MGSDVEPRREFIHKHGREAQLDREIYQALILSIEARIKHACMFFLNGVLEGAPPHKTNK